MPIYEYKPDFLSILKRRKRNVQDFFEKNIGTNISEENVNIIIESLKKEYSLNKPFWAELSKYKKAKGKEIDSLKREEEARAKTALKAKQLEQERVAALREKRKQKLAEEKAKTEAQNFSKEKQQPEEETPENKDSDLSVKETKKTTVRRKTRTSSKRKSD